MVVLMTTTMTLMIKKLHMKPGNQKTDLTEEWFTPKHIFKFESQEASIDLTTAGSRWPREGR
jgi:hypothetical protein